jgi:hypothetical protein
MSHFRPIDHRPLLQDISRFLRNPLLFRLGAPKCDGNRIRPALRNCFVSSETRYDRSVSSSAHAC